MKKRYRFRAGLVLSLLMAALSASVTAQADEIESADGLYEYEVLDNGTSRKLYGSGQRDKD